MDASVQQTLIIALISATTFIVALFMFKKTLKRLKTNNFELDINGQPSPFPVLEPDSARLYTNETVRLTNVIGDLSRRQLLSAMMQHGEEGLTKFCNLIRSDFREFIFSKEYSIEQIETLIQENELIVNQIYREMHGWILLAMRENNIPNDDEGLKKYVKRKCDLWDSITEEIRRSGGRTKPVHNLFLIANKTEDRKYFDIIFNSFKAASKAEEFIKLKIDSAVKSRQKLEDYFVKTAKVGCEDPLIRM